MGNKYKSKLKKLWYRLMLVPVMAITIAMFMFAYATTTAIHAHYKKQVETQAIETVENLSYGIKKSIDAERIINAIIEDKLLSLSKSIAVERKPTNRETLVNVAALLNIDEINVFDKNGAIILSTNEALEGVVISEMHPVSQFSQSTAVHMVENVRANSVTGKMYKYGYFKTSDGNILQMGLLESKIEQLTGLFTYKRIVEEVSALPEVIGAMFILPDNSIDASTYPPYSRDIVGLSDAEQELISKGKSFGRFENKYFSPQFDAFAPIYSGEELIGTLRIKHNSRALYESAYFYSLLTIVFSGLVYFLLLFAISVSHKKNKRLLKTAYYDKVTGLPNSAFLDEYLEGANDAEMNALTIIGFNNFKLATLKYGFEIGEFIVKYASCVLRAFETDKVRFFRFKEEHIAIYTKGLDRAELGLLFSKISSKFEIPLPVSGDKFYLRPQFGCVILNDAPNAKLAERAAAVALATVKTGSGKGFAFYTDDINAKLQREETIEAELREIVAEKDENRLFLYYQPQLNVVTGKVHGFEALARMNSKTLGAVAPVEFIEIAENKNLIVPVGTFLLTQACVFVKRLARQGYCGYRVSVNISIIQLLDENFIKIVKDALEKTGAIASMLEIEITETMISDNYQTINARLQELRDIGIYISLDDFGTGYSSFVRLNELFINALKIDQYFIRTIGTAPGSEHITQNIIDIAHKLGLYVIAEGVENESQHDYLKKMQCDVIQGYLFSKPLPADEIISFISNGLAKDYLCLEEEVI